MKPFKINRDSWHYKLNKNFFNDVSMKCTWEPKHNNFCSYWRATMFRLLFAAALSLIAITMFTILGIGLYLHPIEFLIGFALVVVMTAIPVVTYLLVEFLKDRNKAKGDKPDSLFVQKYKTHKSKICPMVEYD